MDAYHYGLGVGNLSADGENGIWLWRKSMAGYGVISNLAIPLNHASGDWIYLLIREEQDPVFFDYSTSISSKKSPADRDQRGLL